MLGTINCFYFISDLNIRHCFLVFLCDDKVLIKSLKVWIFLISWVKAFATKHDRLKSSKNKLTGTTHSFYLNISANTVFLHSMITILRQMKKIFVELMNRFHYFITQFFLFSSLFSIENCIWSRFLFITAWFS